MSSVTNSGRPKLKHNRMEGFVQSVADRARLEAAVDNLSEAMTKVRLLDAAEALNRLRSHFSYDRWRVIENASYSLRDIEQQEHRESAGQTEA